MSYPRLIVEGEPADKSITRISLEYANDNTGVYKHEGLIRARYNIHRVLINKNLGSGTPSRLPDVPYDHFRLSHTWTGYVDVLTESVCVTDSSTPEDLATMYHLKTAIRLDMSNGPVFYIKTFAPAELGPGDPSSEGALYEAFETGLLWKYDQTDENASSYNWILKDLNIQDNGNNTSRVTFTLNIEEPWVSITDLLTP